MGLGENNYLKRNNNCFSMFGMKFFVLVVFVLSCVVKFIIRELYEEDLKLER